MNDEREYLPPGVADWTTPGAEEPKEKKEGGKEDMKKKLENLGLPVDLENRPIKEQLDLVTRKTVRQAEEFSGSEYRIRAHKGFPGEVEFRDRAFSLLADLVGLRVGILEKLEKSKNTKS